MNESGPGHDQEIAMPRFPRRTTSRLVIREIQVHDWPEIHRYRSDPEMTAWSPEGVFSESQSRVFAEKYGSQKREVLAVVERATDAFVGHMALHPYASTHTYEIGWMIAQPFQRRGYATEAAKSVLSYAFETLKCHRVIATCQPENVPSWRVMEKIGMRREGLLRQCIDRGNEGWWDEFLYAILEEDYLSGSQT